jgi:hypothetical protein
MGIISDRWKDDDRLISLEYGYRRWIGIFAKNTPYTDQGYVSTKDWSDFNDEIKRRWKNGFYIIEVAEGW